MILPDIDLTDTAALVRSEEVSVLSVTYHPKAGTRIHERSCRRRGETYPLSREIQYRRARVLRAVPAPCCRPAEGQAILDTLRVIDQRIRDRDAADAVGEILRGER